MSEEMQAVEQVEADMILTVDDLLNSEPTQEYEVSIQALDGRKVVIRNLTHQEVKKIYDNAADKKGKLDQDQVEQMFVCWASVTPKVTPPIYQKLVQKNAAIIRQYIQAILDVSGLSADAMEQARARFRK